MGMIKNATEKGLLPGEMEIPIYRDNVSADWSNKKAARRMGEIVMSPAESKRQDYDQNGARSDNANPGQPCYDYNATVKGGD